MIALVVATMAVFAETPTLSAPEASQKLISGEIVMLDIRSEQEWAETGVPKGAWPVSMHTPDFPQQLRAVLARYTPDQISLICATGGRSAHVADVLENNGITGVADVSEGMFGNGQNVGWIARGLPVVPIEDARALLDSARAAWE